MSQLPLPIAFDARGEAGRLLVTPAHQEALTLLRDWQRWPSPASLLIGPPKSGRTLLGRLFAAESGGEFIDDAERVDEEHLFNQWNLARDSGRPLLLVAREAPPLWSIKLPDLRTRLATAAIARIGPPDEAVAASLVTRGLELAGSAFANDVPEYIARRVTRCYESIDSLVAQLNAESLARGRKLTVAQARTALEDLGARASSVESKDEGAGTSG